MEKWTTCLGLGPDTVGTLYYPEFMFENRNSPQSLHLKCQGLIIYYYVQIHILIII